MTKPLQPHGTTGAYQRHRKRGEEPCDDCRAAQATYMRELRRNPNVREADRAQAKAYKAAESRLRERHRAEFDALYAEELAAVDRRATERHPAWLTALAAAWGTGQFPTNDVPAPSPLWTAPVAGLGQTRSRGWREDA